MIWKKKTPENSKIGDKCFISFKGNDRNYVTYFGKKDGLYLYKDITNKHKIFSLTLAEAKSKVFVELKK